MKEKMEEKKINRITRELKEKGNGYVVIEQYGSDCPVCPACKNHNAMLEGRDNSGGYYLECCDCGYGVNYEYVKMRYPEEE